MAEQERPDGSVRKSRPSAARSRLPWTVTIGGQVGTSASLARLFASVKIIRASLAPTRCSIAFGPKAVNNG